MKLTTESILNRLPISLELRDKLLQKLAAADADTKFNMEREIWDAYFELEEGKVQDNIHAKMEKIKNKEDGFGEDFYADSLKVIEEDTKKANIQADDTAELQQIRTRLQGLMN